MTEIEKLQHELDRQQAQIGVLTELCIALLYGKTHGPRGAVLDEFTRACDVLIASTLDGTEGTDVQADEVREFRTAVRARFNP
ncbi:hypothetical protein [Paraburkholderia youngii]|uniref:hypothetical protein n=1 Tax=Paraburkholderia youngii TaxID=2782701 RepID=UPI001590D978|nr:hypothetical protein [Paraburkholderia youngii]NUX55947.1 hypothetical protein [Paraburkholderia youngii]